MAESLGELKHIKPQQHCSMNSITLSKGNLKTQRLKI